MQGPKAIVIYAVASDALLGSYMYAVASSTCLADKRHVSQSVPCIAHPNWQHVQHLEAGHDQRYPMEMPEPGQQTRFIIT